MSETPRARERRGPDEPGGGRAVDGRWSRSLRRRALPDLRTGPEGPPPHAVPLLTPGRRGALVDVHGDLEVVQPSSPGRRRRAPAPPPGRPPPRRRRHRPGRLQLQIHLIST